MESYTVTQFEKLDSNHAYSSYVFGADIGGTNTKIGFAGITQGKPVLLFTLHFKSNDSTSFSPILKESLNYAKQEFHIDVRSGCIGAAGVISAQHDTAALTNIPWIINCGTIKKETGVKHLFVINDFQAIGHGIRMLDKQSKDDFAILRPTVERNMNQYTKAIIGAGTGLGKCLLIYDKKNNQYHPCPSEGGHADIPIYSSKEFDLIKFIQTKFQQHYPVTYEQVLSGPGLYTIYEFLKQKESYESMQNVLINHPNDISEHRNDDVLCQKTYAMFLKFYARCIKNFILDTMALGGVYLAGGIAMENTDIFQSDEFLNEIENSFQRNSLLHKVPVYIIKNINVGLLGACLAATQR